MKTQSNVAASSGSSPSHCSAVKVGFSAPGMSVGFECTPGVANRLVREILRAILESNLDSDCADSCPKCGGKETISDETGTLCAACMELFLPPNIQDHGHLPAKGDDE